MEQLRLFPDADSGLRVPITRAASPLPRHLAGAGGGGVDQVIAEILHAESHEQLALALVWSDPPAKENTENGSSAGGRRLGSTISGANENLNEIGNENAPT